MAKKVYTAEQRQQALRLAEKYGATEAARRVGMPYGTVSSMVHDARLKGEERVTPAVPALANPLPMQEWDGTQGAVADRYGRLVEAQLGVAEELLLAGRYREHKDVILASAIATDKAQLLSGHATSRSESRSLVAHATVERIGQLIARLPGAQGLVVPSDTAPDLPILAASTEVVDDAGMD